MTVDRVSAATDPVLGELTGPGGAFEIVTEDVLGVPLQVYKNRLTSLRDIIAMADARAGVDFLVQGDRRVTYDEHNALVRRVAAAFQELGVEHGDRVAILSANNVEWVVLFWAAAAIGAVVVPLNAWWKADELEFVLRDSGAKLLFCDPKRWPVVRDLVDPLRSPSQAPAPATAVGKAAAAASLPELEHVFVMDLEERDGVARPGTDLLADDPGALPDIDVDEDDLFAILYTSGTTGRPKGATLTHRQALANLQNIFCLGVANASRGGEAAPELSSDVQSATLLVVPLFHVTGCLSTMMLCYASGAKLVLMPPGRFDPDAAMATIERERITGFGGVPTIMWRIVESPNFDHYDLSSVVRVSYGGAPAAAELVQRIHERFPKVRKTLATAYGLTESASVATSNTGDDYRTHPDSVGRPAPTVEIRVVDPDGEPVPVGGTGEIWLRGPTIMRRGYWNRPDATAEAITPDGWFRSGDIGRFDEDGFLYLVDRQKDMIIRGGENVYCVEVEEVLFEHPDVIDAAVVGVPHKVLGEEVKAVVQVKAGSSTTVESLRAHCASRLADFKVPAHVELRDEPLPRNPAGKVLKSLLRGDETPFSADAADDSAL
ncbi:MAG TPA: class I adenylate-forming enzyme family protein [Acidimicrobiia bacterium]|nr:class I adenylate-forming enzyme family protein [Acidimicrobiia bacterium]